MYVAYVSGLSNRLWCSKRQRLKLFIFKIVELLLKSELVVWACWASYCWSLFYPWFYILKSRTDTVTNSVTLIHSLTSWRMDAGQWLLLPFWHQSNFSLSLFVAKVACDPISQPAEWGRSFSYWCCTVFLYPSTSFHVSLLISPPTQFSIREWVFLREGQKWDMCGWITDAILRCLYGVLCKCVSDVRCRPLRVAFVLF